eukprot:CAMPEP_0174261362 /NCGR_PEP_ID=MMETSP0439-20130205/11380_1 /TAXON_ID=0 /ORGANISM="Stereomyxa ramosa, Strain Chinc5" /LENGTH=986 /DNA_ID=CAMNT_0015345823 /DNA_START=77 /DNA_END=3037 /DNA_ORIENTATION=+
MKPSYIISLVIVALLSVCYVASNDFEAPYSFVVTHLNSFQTSNGGFKATLNDDSPTLEATSHALLLSSLFGLRNKINPNNAASYIQTLENGDYGYGKSAGLASDLESVRHAVVSYQHLGMGVPNSGNVATFIKSLYVSDTHLFANRVGEKGDLKSTALAFQALESLGELQRTWVEESLDHVRKYLKKHQAGNHFEFPEEQSLSLLSANYYAIVLASHVGFDFGDAKRWAHFIAGLQSKEGGFYDSADKKSTSLESSVHAISSLRVLQSAPKESSHFVDLVDTDSLATYASFVTADLGEAARAHLAIALTKGFVNNFEVDVSYEILRSSRSIEKRVVQGTQLKPILSVKTFGGISHAGLDIDVAVTFTDTKEVRNTKLRWKDTEQYASDEFFDTAGHLGALKFEYTIRCYVGGVGEISFSQEDVKQIGYNVVVDSQARLDVTEKQFKEGDTVALHTAFHFGLNLGNTTNEFSTGDFSVTFKVLDSSEVAIHSTTRDRRANSDALAFDYTLTSSNIPSGDLYFVFEVANKNGVHTVETVTYKLSLLMIASNINFNSRDQTYKIGEKVKVTVEPATFPDLRTTYSYPATDVAGNKVAAQRKFFMDVKSPAGSLLHTIAGKPESGDNKQSVYSFEIEVSPSLDSIGSNLVSFRYETASGQSIDLSNYDSNSGELYEDSSVLSYKVNAELHMVDVKEQPSTNDYYYGNTINFRFKVLDKISGANVERGNNEQANVYLSLEHRDENRAKKFVSANEAATQEGDEYSIVWSINPNAVQGDGHLIISAQDADGNHLPLLNDKNKPVVYEVNIGGEINVESSTFSTSEFNFDDLTFISQFTLACQGKSLEGAQLKASVVRRASEGDEVLLENLPVATSDSGEYSLSFFFPIEEAPSGTYTLNFYREIDRKRALEAKQLKEKKRLREEQLRQFSEGEEAESQEPEEAEEKLEPLFTIDIKHTAPTKGQLPVRTEVIALVLFGGVFFMFSYQKKHYA